ncbi:methylmalonyl Co-A mutase-associated GTPase MeaB [Halobellus salinus]|uniref:Methylmalonyl Co-A mutase-associated GTPase MeaB n=1 Tax=Halobellus salinus TaxID=931585 RepID=A0A830ERP0_9EURY|nr:methylmalonyl Co-A mutase-associated GTPase MeaB [Halobellus salinus]GGJ15094.1 methylmalonyl Co-A mutase-associated GTPase MeaB [Halobellus salinus]SMP32701.1 LAO/AO transport system kinase [Halobellus salinus]
MTRPDPLDDSAGDRNRRLVASLLDGDHRALARVISRIEDRAPGHRDLVSRLYPRTGDAEVVGITGSPGAGKSTLVDKLAAAYRDRGDTVGVVAVDPASPYSGGSVLGDRIRMAATVGDMDVFVRSMSARGRLGGLSTATTDAVNALDAFGKDVVLVETVGAGQNEVDIVRTADTVAVVAQPGSGDDVQMLKAGILEIGDVFVVNKADMNGVDRLIADLEEMLHRGGSGGAPVSAGGHHGASVGANTPETGPGGGDSAGRESGSDPGTGGDIPSWDPRVVTTVATGGDGIGDLVDAFDAHASYLQESGAGRERARSRYAAEIRRLIREDANALLDAEIRRRGGVDALAERVLAGDTDPYTVASEVVEPIADIVNDGRLPREATDDAGDTADDSNNAADERGPDGDA